MRPESGTLPRDRPMANTRKNSTRKADTPKPTGAPRGNSNSMRHGLRAGKLPPKCQYIEHQMNRLRRELEDATMKAKGRIDLADAANIQTAVKWERHGALCLRWLRIEGDNLKPLERLQFSREIARASTERDKAVERLDLGRDPVELAIARLYAPDEVDDGPEHVAE